MKKIGNRKIHTVESRRVRQNTDYTTVGRTGRIDTDRRILEHNAVRGTDAELFRGAKVNIGRWFGSWHLAAIDDRAETRSKPGAVQHEIDIRGLGIRSERHRASARAVEKLGHARHQITIQLGADHLPEQAFLGGAMLEYDLRVDVRPEKVTHDFVIPPAVHPRLYVVAFDSQGLKITLPRPRVN